MTATNKPYSCPKVVAIQIDVHPTEEKPINMPHTFHAQFIYGPEPNISHGPCRQPFASPHKDEIGPYTRGKSWWPKTDWPGRRLGSPHSPLPHDSIGVGEGGFGHVVTQLHQLTGAITLAWDWYVWYLLTSTNHSILNWHRQGLQPWKWWLSTHHSPTFPTDAPPLST
jgi:hypothetical protein